MKNAHAIELSNGIVRAYNAKDFAGMRKLMHPDLTSRTSTAASHTARPKTCCRSSSASRASSCQTGG